MRPLGTADWYRKVGKLLPKGKTMGLVRVPVTIRTSKKSRKKFQAEFLADTGAIDCMAPASELKRAGIRVDGDMPYELADGSIAHLSFGLAVIEVMGGLTAGRVIFRPDGTEPILGVTVLESLGLVIDPKNQELKRLPAISLK